MLTFVTFLKVVTFPSFRGIHYMSSLTFKTVSRNHNFTQFLTLPVPFKNVEVLTDRLLQLTPDVIVMLSTVI